MSATALAVTGAGMVTAAGRGVGPAWEALCERRCFPARADDPMLAGFPGLRIALAPRLDPEELGADRRAARLMGHHSCMLLACASEALSQAVEGDLPGEEIAFFAGMDSVDMADEDLAAAASVSSAGGGEVDYGRFFSQGMGAIHPLWPLGMLNAISFSQVAIHFGLRGENAVFSPGGEATARAFAEAADSLRRGKARAALVAGVSAVVSPRAVARCVQHGLLDRDGAGPALGEGAAVLVLEPDNARRAGGKTLGRLLGCGTARSLGGPSGQEQAVRRAVEAALAEAGLAAEAIDLVIPHRAGEEETDRIESQALAALFGGKEPRVLATKAAFGHLLGGAPVVDLLLAFCALSEGEAATGGKALRYALVLCRGLDDTWGAFVAGARPPKEAD